jgi:hypothetical protein
MNSKLLKTGSVIILSCISLASCVSDGDTFDYSPRYQRPYEAGPREGPRYDRGDNDENHHPRWDRDGRRGRDGWRDRDNRGDDSEDRRERRGRGYWMEDNG